MSAADERTLIVQVKAWWERMVWPTVFMLACLPLINTLGNYFGPKWEPSPIQEVKIESAHCDGLDLMIMTSFTKVTAGKFRELTVMVEAPNELPRAVKWLYLGERDTGERPADGRLQYGGPMRIFGACGHPFTFHLWYHSAYGWWDTYRAIGPFGPFGVPPSVAQQMG